MVQRREAVPEAAPARTQGGADRARPPEHGPLVIRQLPEHPTVRALHRGFILTRTVELPVDDTGCADISRA
jgi:hypothetical protein